jgi:hypothetical protein
MTSLWLFASDMETYGRLVQTFLCNAKMRVPPVALTESLYIFLIYTTVTTLTALPPHPLGIIFKH